MQNKSNPLIEALRKFSIRGDPDLTIPPGERPVEDDPVTSVPGPSVMDRQPYGGDGYILAPDEPGSVDPSEDNWLLNRETLNQDFTYRGYMIHPGETVNRTMFEPSSGNSDMMAKALREAMMRNRFSGRREELPVI